MVANNTVLSRSSTFQKFVRFPSSSAQTHQLFFKPFSEQAELSASSSEEGNFFEPDFSIKVEDDDDSSSDYSSSGSFNAASAFSHLANHSYAASADLMFSGKSSSSSSFSYDFKYDGASALASASPMSFW